MKNKSKAIATAAMCALFVAAAGIGTTTAFMTGSSKVTNRINIANEGIDAVILESDWDGIIGYNEVNNTVLPVYAYMDNPDDRTSELKPVYGFEGGDYSKPIFSSSKTSLGGRATFNSEDEAQTFIYGDESAKLMIPGNTAAKNPCIKNTTKFSNETEWAAMKITFVYASGKLQGQPLKTDDMLKVYGLIDIDYNCDGDESDRRWKRIDEDPYDGVDVAASDVSQVFYYDSLVSNGETTEPIFTRVTFKETASAADITALEKMGGFVIYAEGFVMQSRSFSEDYNDFEAYGIEGGVNFADTPTAEKPLIIT